jgi:hypothetical protein
MKSKRFKATLSMLMMAAGAASLAACAMEADADQQAQSAQSVLAADEQTPAEQTPAEATDSATNATDETDPRVSCRVVTASSIPVFSAPAGTGVLCRFPRGTRFSHFGPVITPFGTRYITWCPLGVPPSQGTTGYAQGAGTVDGGCG